MSRFYPCLYIERPIFFLLCNRNLGRGVPLNLDLFLLILHYKYRTTKSLKSEYQGKPKHEHLKDQSLDTIVYIGLYICHGNTCDVCAATFFRILDRGSPAGLLPGSADKYTVVMK